MAGRSYCLEVALSCGRRSYCLEVTLSCGRRSSWSGDRSHCLRLQSKAVQRGVFFDFTVPEHKGTKTRQKVRNCPPKHSATYRQTLKSQPSQPDACTGIYRVCHCNKASALRLHYIRSHCYQQIYFPVTIQHTSI